MTTVYLILPGTRVQVCRVGGEFCRPRVLKVQLQFHEPIATTDSTMTFADGDWRILVDWAKVVVSRYDGQRGVTVPGRYDRRNCSHREADHQE
jgi:hypothetical protein